MRPRRIARAEALGRYPSSWAALITRARVCALYRPPDCPNTFPMVRIERPVCRAMSLIVIRANPCSNVITTYHIVITRQGENKKLLRGDMLRMLNQRRAKSCRRDGGIRERLRRTRSLR